MTWWPSGGTLRSPAIPASNISSTSPRCTSAAHSRCKALRLTVGDDAFFTILRTYASRFAGKNVTTADFIAVTNEVAGHDLHDLFDAWLYRAPLPALPS